MAPVRGGNTPGLEKFLDSLKGRPVEASVELLISLLKRRQIKGSEACASATAHILLQVVARDKWADVDQLLGRIQTIGRRLVTTQPHELAIGNIVKRVLGLIRDEASEDRNDVSTNEPDVASPNEPPRTGGVSEVNSPAKPLRPMMLSSLKSFARTQSMFNLTADSVNTPPWSNASTPKQGSGASTPIISSQLTNVNSLRSEVIDGIEEIMDEIKQVDEQIQTYADTLIHTGDYILVYQPSKTVQKFLTRAASKRKYTLLLTLDSSAQSTSGDPYASLRKSLTSHGSRVVTVTNGSLTLYMSRINKVIVGSRAITAHGDVVIDGGSAAIARAAHSWQRTVLVLGGVYIVSPESEVSPKRQTEFGDPSSYVGFSDGPLVSGATVKHAAYEVLHASLVDTYITNLGAHTRDNLHTIIADHYKEEDIQFDLFERL